jgi:hypothetical protein
MCYTNHRPDPASNLFFCKNYFFQNYTIKTLKWYHFRLLAVLIQINHLNNSFNFREKNNVLNNSLFLFFCGLGLGIVHITGWITLNFGYVLVNMLVNIFTVGIRLFVIFLWVIPVWIFCHCSNPLNCFAVATWILLHLGYRYSRIFPTAIKMILRIHPVIL